MFGEVHSGSLLNDDWWSPCLVRVLKTVPKIIRGQSVLEYFSCKCSFGQACARTKPKQHLTANARNQLFSAEQSWILFYSVYKKTWIMVTRRVPALPGGGHGLVDSPTLKDRLTLVQEQPYTPNLPRKVTESNKYNYWNLLLKNSD